jgi:KDO2-lipid IV(A) lauroyltransferase
MAQKLTYLLYPLLYGLSLLPLGVLYRFSELLYGVIYHLLGYRRKVVADNLRRSFPDKSEAERRRIERAFYRHFCDLLVECLKLLTMSPSALRRRVRFPEADRQEFLRFAREGRSIVAPMAHLGNWEWAGVRFGLEPEMPPLYAIYHPLSNRAFDRLVQRMRTRLGNRLYRMKRAFHEMYAHRDALTVTAFIADQTPRPRSAYWTEFLHQDTPFFEGTERIARKLGQPVVYVAIEKEGRGRYRIRAEALEPQPANSPPGRITEAYVRRLEADIRQEPRYWLWSHRRWKHRRAGSA